MSLWQNILLDLKLLILLWNNIYGDRLNELLLRRHLIQMLLLLMLWRSLVVKLPGIIWILSHNLNRLNIEMRLLIDLAIWDYCARSLGYNRPLGHKWYLLLINLSLGILLNGLTLDLILRHLDPLLLIIIVRLHFKLTNVKYY